MAFVVQVHQKIKKKKIIRSKTKGISESMRNSQKEEGFTPRTWEVFAKGFQP